MGPLHHPAAQPPQAAPHLARGAKVQCTNLRPKNSNVAIKVRNCATQKVPWGYGRQTNRQTNEQTDKLSPHYSKIQKTVLKSIAPKAFVPINQPCLYNVHSAQLLRINNRTLQIPPQTINSSFKTIQ